MTENSKSSPFWSVSESQILKFSSTMVKVWLGQKAVKLGHFGAFQKEVLLVLYLFFGILGLWSRFKWKKNVSEGWNSGAILRKAGKSGKGSLI